MIRRFFKWLFSIAGILFGAVLIGLVVFRILSKTREKLSPSAAAPSSGKFVRATDLQIFIQESGSPLGPGVVLIHGTGAWSELWRGTITALTSKGFHVIAVDVPPFGFSDKPSGSDAYARQKQAARILGVLDALDLHHVTLVGHSVGARPTIEAALARPDRIAKLVLVDPALGFSADLQTPHFEQNHPSRIVSALFAFAPVRNVLMAAYGTNPLFTRKLFQSFVSNKAAVTDSRVKTLQQPLIVDGITQGEADWLKSLMIEKDTSLSSDFSNLRHLRMPVLFIWGSTDQVTPLSQGEALQRLIPQSTLKVIDGAGHIPYIEDTTQFNEALLNFLKMSHAPSMTLAKLGELHRGRGR